MKIEKLRPGPVKLIEKDGSFITVIQGKNELLGSYAKSNNGRYIVTYCDGHEIDGEWENGEICLIEQSMTAIWSKSIERPNNCMVSNDGKVVVNDWLRYTGELRGLFYAFTREGNILIEQRFDSNLCSCVISDDGRYASVSLAFPNNHIYCYDLEHMKPIWKYENHSKSPVLGLSFSPGYMLDVYTGKTEATKIKNYSINIAGKLDDADAQRMMRFQTVKKNKTTDAIQTFLSMLESPHVNEVRESLNELKSKVDQKRFRDQLRELSTSLSKLLLHFDEEVMDLSEHIILKIGKLNAQAIETAIPTILKKSAQMQQSPFAWIRERNLYVLGCLGAINPSWIEKEIPYLLDTLENSCFWNERRFAAIAIGNIGSKESHMIKDAVPILIRYLESPEWWLSKILKEAQKDEMIGSDLAVAQGMGVRPEDWVIDAVIPALGEIGEKDPELVKRAIPLLITCLDNPSKYTRKRAIEALASIGSKNKEYIETASRVIQYKSVNDPDEKVRTVAKILLKKFAFEEK